MAQTKNLKLTLTPDSEASSTTFKTWRNAINGDNNSNMQKIDDFAEQIINYDYKVTWSLPSKWMGEVENIKIFDRNGTDVTNSISAEYFNPIKLLFAGPNPFPLGAGDGAISLNKISAYSSGKNFHYHGDQPELTFAGIFGSNFNYEYLDTYPFYAINFTIIGYTKILKIKEITAEINPCLIEGTEITMSDNSIKTIEQVKAGDIVLSYDPIAKTKTNAIVLAAYKTGSSNDFMTYSFENGSFITAYGIEGYYENTEGAIKDLQKITKQDELITQDLTYTYFYLKKPYFHHGEKKNRYSLIVSNNLYFANGILLGHSPYKKYWGILEGLFTVPNDIKTIYKEECNKYNEFTDFINTKEYQAEVADSYSKLAKANEAIRTYKEKLSETDYKVQKYTEGVLTEAEWEEAKANRAAWRQVVNDNQELRRSLSTSVKTILNKYRKGITPKDLFEESCTKDNESFEIIKNYFDN